MKVEFLHPACTLAHLGYWPEFINEADPRPAKEQFNANYRHGGWQPMNGLTMHGTTLHYPGDPPFRPIAKMTLRNEVILLYEYDIVAIVQPDGSFEAARMD